MDFLIWGWKTHFQTITEAFPKHYWLVVDLPLWKILVSWDDYSQYMEKYNSCSKPPTSCCMSMVSGDCAQPSVSSVSSVGMWEKQPSHPERLHGSCGGVTACAVQHEWATRVWSKSGIHKLSPTSHYISGWWLTYPSEKYEFVSWDDDTHTIWKKNVPNHQPV